MVLIEVPPKQTHSKHLIDFCHESSITIILTIVTKTDRTGSLSNWLSASAMTKATAMSIDLHLWMLLLRLRGHIEGRKREKEAEAKPKPYKLRRVIPQARP